MHCTLFNEIKSQERALNHTLLPDDKSVDDFTTYIPSLLANDDVFLEGLRADVDKLGITGKKSKSRVQTKWVGQFFKKKD